MPATVARDVAGADARSASDSSRTSALRRVLETSPFPILLVSLVGIVLLSVFGPSLVVGDTWLTLMAGREVVEHGLPSTETITILGQGATWTDQQWLAQVVFYGAHGLAGMRAVSSSRPPRAPRARLRDRHGPDERRLVALDLPDRPPRRDRGPWGWTIARSRPPSPSSPGRSGSSSTPPATVRQSRTLLVLPLLVLWANLHGSVVLGAGLTVLLGIVELVRSRRLAWMPVALVVLAPLCVLASPYGAKSWTTTT